MLKRERQAYILHQVQLHNKVLSVKLCQDINVSNDTIRRDLQELAEEGKIIKVHGGALAPHGSGQPASNSVYSYVKKVIIAQKAAHLVKDGMFVLTGGGTTIMEFARALPQELHATFISGSLPLLMEYSRHPNIDVIAIGDRISKNAQITIGPGAMTSIAQIRADLCFLGINAIDTDRGITDNDWDIVQMKKAMIAASGKTVCLTISEKINTCQPVKVCALGDIDVLITELPADDPLLRPYIEAGITVL